jgi:hypothetical protein
VGSGCPGRIDLVAARSVGGPVTALVIVTLGGLDSYFAELHATMRSNADPAEMKWI